MDRNVLSAINEHKGSEVATREGGVDRNIQVGHTHHFSLQVATREGGVDRNLNPDGSVKQRC